MLQSFDDEYTNCFAINGSLSAIQVTFFMFLLLLFVLLEKQWIFKEKLPTDKKDIKGEKAGSHSDRYN